MGTKLWRPALPICALLQGTILPNLVSDSYNNAQDETMIAFFKAEVIHRLGPKKSVDADEWDTFK